MNRETPTSPAAHLAWCALTALHIARRHDGVAGEVQENLFLTRWLAEAQRRRLFPRETARDVDWLLRQGRTLGPRAKLRDKIEYLWHSCSGELMAQNDMFRLTYALELAGKQAWAYRLLSDTEWSGRRAIRLNEEVNGVYLLKSSLDAAFDDDGCQFAPLQARLTGCVSGISQLLLRCGWKALAQDDTPHLFVLMATGSNDE